MKNLVSVSLMLAFLIAGVSLKAQDILYSENFSNALLNNKGQNGITFDITDVTNWTINVSSGTFAAGDWFKQTTAGYFESYDTDASAASPVYWYSTVTDISCYSNVTVSADLGRQSSNSSSGCRASYSIDGGAWVTFGEKIGSGGAEAFETYSANGLSGNTIQIRIAHWGTSSTPYYRHDNVTITATPTYPSLQASGLNIIRTGTTADLSWTNGNGDAVIVVAKQVGTPHIDPVKGTVYSADAIFGTGDETGAGNYVVYNSTGNSVTVTGLTTGTDYEFSVYAYNSAGPCYNMNELMGSTECTQPVTQASGSSCGSITANSMLVSWTNGSGDRVLVVGRKTSDAVVDPSNSLAYIAGAAFGTGDQTGAGNFVVYDGTGTSVTVTGLISSTNYTFSVYTYNSADYCYNLTENTCNGTTLTISSPYLMSAVNGMIIPTCSGNFYDSGGAGGNYSNGETYQTTFCSNSGLPLKFDFSSSGDFNMESGSGDTLFFYDGMTASGTPFAMLSQSDDIPFSQLMINTLSECVTIVWKSNGASVDGGWHAVISCGEPPVCLDNLPAADVFGQATPMCNINDYCGTTAGYYGEDLPFNLNGGGDCPVPFDGIFAGTIENNSWLKFEALATSASFDFNCPIGGTCNQGIQVAIFDFDEGTQTFSLKSPCSFTNGAHSNSFTVTASSLTIGETYYIMIDGNAGDQCDYTIGVNTGVVVIDAGPDQVVCETFTTLNAQATLNSGTWTVLFGTGIFADEHDPNTIVTGLSDGNNVFQWTSTSSICGEGSDEVIVVSTSCLPVELITFDAIYLSPSTISVKWSTASELNNDFFILERSEDGSNFNPVARIEGNGTSNTMLHYSIFDNTELSQIYYYRLKQTDFDGTVSVSQIISAVPDFAYHDGELIVSYSDYGETLEIYFNSETSGQYLLSLTSVSGHKYYTIPVTAEKGINIWQINSDDIRFGISIIALENDFISLKTKLYR